MTNIQSLTGASYSLYKKLYDCTPAIESQNIIAEFCVKSLPLNVFASGIPHVGGGPVEGVVVNQPLDEK